MAFFGIRGGGGSVKQETVLANWDFTKSLVDTKNGYIATLHGATRDANGVNISTDTDWVELPTDLIRLDTVFEITFGNMNLTSSGTSHSRLFCFLPYSYTGTGTNANHGIAYHYQTQRWGVWDSVYTWRDSDISDINFFANSTMKVYIDARGNWRIYKDNALVFEPQNPLPVASKILAIGSAAQSCQTCVIKSIKVISPGGISPSIDREKDVIIYSKYREYSSQKYDKYDVSSLTNVIVKNVSAGNSQTTGKNVLVYLDDVLVHTIGVDGEQVIDVSNASELNIQVQSLNTDIYYVLILKDCSEFYEYYNRGYSTIDKILGMNYDITKFTSLVITNKSASSSSDLRKLNVFLDGKDSYNYQISVGDTLSVDITNNCFMRLMNNSNQAQVLADVYLS